MRYPCRRTNAGTILILALWTLGFLSVFAVYLGIFVRQKMALLSRLEKRSAVQQTAEAGVRRAKAVFDSSHAVGGVAVTGIQKQQWFNNLEHFRHISLGRGYFDVCHQIYDLSGQSLSTLYGFSDEERRLNVNTADRFILARLIETVTGLPSKQARDLARAIVSWREYGETDIVGFYSDAFYENLEFPYPPKKKDFELLDELLLVKGMNPKIYRELIDFLTVYGSGKVNINTASAPVLTALGLAPETVSKILTARRGPDQIESTWDDYMFLSRGDRGGIVADKRLGLKADELAMIEQLFARELLGVASDFFRVYSRGQLENSQESMMITCVFEGQSGRIFYWREKREQKPTAAVFDAPA